MVAKIVESKKGSNDMLSNVRSRDNYQVLLAQSKPFLLSEMTVFGRSIHSIVSVRLQRKGSSSPLI